jgi:hypothetical protein
MSSSCANVWGWSRKTISNEGYLGCQRKRHPFEEVARVNYMYLSAVRFTTRHFHLAHPPCRSHGVVWPSSIATIDPISDDGIVEEHFYTCQWRILPRKARSIRRFLFYELTCHASSSVFCYVRFVFPVTPLWSTNDTPTCVRGCR